MSVTVIMPVKPFGLAKSRLRLPHEERALLAEAFARDVFKIVTETAEVGAVVVVTADRGFAGFAGRKGAAILHDRPMLGGDSLNTAIRAGVRWAIQQQRQSALAVVPSDLAALRPLAFDDALAALGRHEWSFVPDESGVGTTLLFARRPVELRPAYGLASASHHIAAGATRVTGVDQSVRLDVDTAEDLLSARRLGLGAHAQAVVDAWVLRTGDRPIEPIARGRG